MSFSTKPRRRVAIDFDGDIGLTEQHHKDSCDIHKILKSAHKTGVIEHTTKYQGTYGDMPSGDEFHNHMNIVAAAESMFETVPSSIRKEFDNDAAKYLDFMQDNKNYDAIEEMGLDPSHLKKPDRKPDPKPVENTVE